MKKTERIYTPFESFHSFMPTLKERGDRVMFRFPKGKEYGQTTYGEFYQMVMREAAAMQATGLAGKRIAVIGETSPQWVATYFAAIASGGVIIPMDKELEVSEISGFLSGVEAEAIVFDKHMSAKFAPLFGEHPTLKTFIAIEAPEEKPEGVISLDDFLAKGDEPLAAGYKLPVRDPQSLAIMLFTSGTTGTSKCVMLSEKNICTATMAACASVNFFPQDVTTSVLPLHHTYEMTIMLASISYGFEIGINDSLRHLMRNLREYKPTGLILVPLFVSTMYKRIWDEARKQGKDKLLARMLKVSEGLRRVGIDLRRKFFKSILDSFGGRLEKIICGGAALNPELVKKFDAFGIQICEGYGITECSPLIAVTPYYAPKPGSVGPAVPNCEARIAVTGKNEHNYDEGEIQVRGGNVMLGYYHNDEENAKAFTEDGWYRTGDVGYMDEDGYIYITGRMKSVIVLENGKNVFPEEIEEYLARIPEIGESVVVGRKDGETVNLTAVVYPAMELFPEGTDKDTVYRTIYEKITSLNRELPSFKKIKALELRDTEFEKTTSRKIKRHLVH